MTKRYLANSHREFARIYRDRATTARRYADSPTAAERQWADETAALYDQLAEAEDRFATALAEEAA